MTVARHLDGRPETCETIVEVLHSEEHELDEVMIEDEEIEGTVAVIVTMMTTMTTEEAIAEVAGVVETGTTSTEV